MTFAIFKNKSQKHYHETITAFSAINSSAVTTPKTGHQAPFPNSIFLNCPIVQACLSFSLSLKRNEHLFEERDITRMYLFPFTWYFQYDHFVVRVSRSCRSTQVRSCDSVLARACLALCFHGRKSQLPAHPTHCHRSRWLCIFF